ncbi:Golgin subfamily B member 1 372 kDa Golgi complex-associated protein [Channa argus]|uniref:Golgin subfamily B member 1 372 kDa Golgi complex-associated protein n=1 Tax=Channa argus TaxID=215402 RepID=A0A6G1P809_CHAAH|nr:Golgin subfamily B member 1 372 kDa Golgi complex-associated protein [Channa argus]
MAERLTQTEQLVTQLKEMIREKDAALRVKDDQLKGEKETCEAKLSKLRLQNKAKVTSLTTQLEELKKQQGGQGTPTHRKKGSSEGGGEQASRGKIVLLKKKVEELEQQLAQREEELERERRTVESQQQRGEEMDAMLTEKDRKLAEKEAYIVHLQTALAGDQPVTPAPQQKMEEGSGAMHELQLLVQSLTRKVGEADERYSLLQEQTDSLKELVATEKEQYSQKESMYKQNIQTFKDIILQKDNQLMQINQMHEQELFKLAAKSDASADLEQLLKALKQKLHEKEEVLLGKTQVIDVLQREVDGRDQQIKELTERLRRLQIERESLESKMEAEKHVMRAQLRDLMEKQQVEVQQKTEQHQAQLSQVQQDLLGQIEELRRTSVAAPPASQEATGSGNMFTDSASIQRIAELEGQAKQKTEEATRSEAKFLKMKAWSKSRIRQLEDELKKSQAGVAPPDLTALRSRITALEEEREEILWKVEQYEELKTKNEMLEAKLVLYEEQQKTLQADLEQFTKRAASQASESGSADDTQSQVLEWQEMVAEAVNARDRAREEKSALSIRISHLEEEREDSVSLASEVYHFQEDFEFDGQAPYQDPRSISESTTPMEGENMGGWWPEYSTPDTDGLRSVVEELELERNQLQEQILSLEERCQDLEDRLQLQARIEALQVTFDVEEDQQPYWVCQNESEKLQSQLATVRSQQSRDAEKHQLLVNSLNEQLKGLSDTQECLESSLIEKENTLAKTSEKLELINSLRESLSEKEIQYKGVSDKLLQTEHTLESLSKKYSSSEKQCSGLKNEVADLMQKLNVLKEKTQKQEVTVETLQTELEQTNEELDKLNTAHLEERSQLIHDLQSCEREIDSLKDILVEKDKEILTLSGNMVEYAEQVTVLKQEIKVKEENLVQVENALSKAQREAMIIRDSQNSDQQTLNSKITELVGKLKDTEMELVKAKEEGDSKEAEVEHLIKQAEEDKKTIQDLRGEIQKHIVSHQNHLSECETHIASLKEQLTLSTSKLQESEGLASQLKDKNTCNEKLQQQLQDKEHMYKKELKSVKEEQNRLLTQVEKYNNEMQSLSKQLEEQVKSEEHIRKDIEEKLDTIASLENQLKINDQQLEDERQKFNSELQVRDSENLKLTNELQSKTENISKLKNILKSMKTEKEQLHDKLKGLNEELDIQKRSAQEVNEKVKSALELNSSLENQVRCLTQENERLEQELSERVKTISEVKVEKDSLLDKMSMLETQHSANIKVIEGLHKDKEELIVRNNELNKVLESSTHSNSEILLAKTNECSNLSQLLRESEDKVTQLHEKVQSLMSVVDQLHQDTAEKDQAATDLRAQLEAQHKENTHLQETLSVLQEQQCSLTSAIKEKGAMLKEKQEEYVSLENKVTTQGNLVSKLQVEAELLNEERSQLRQQLQDREEVLKNMTHQCQKHKDELNDAKMTAKLLTEENQQLRVLCESREKELDQQKQVVSDFNGQLKATLEQNSSFTVKISSLTEDNQRLQEELAHKNNSVIQLTTEKSFLQENKSGLESQISDNQKTIEVKEAECESLKEQILHLEESVTKLSNTLQVQVADVENLQKALEEKETALMEKSKSLQDVQRRTDEALLFKAQFMESTELVSLLQSQMYSLSTECENLKKSAEETQSAFNNLQEKYAANLEEFQEVKKQLSQRSDEVSNLRTILDGSNNEHQMAKTTIESLRNELAASHQQLEKTKNLNSVLSKEKDDALASHQANVSLLTVEIERLKSQHLQVVAQMNSLTENLEQREIALHAINNQYTAQAKQASQLVSEIQKLEEQNKSLSEKISLSKEENKKHLNVLSNENINLQQEIRKLLAEKEELEQRHQQMWTSQGELQVQMEQMAKMMSEKESLQAEVSAKDEELCQLKENIQKIEQILQDSEKEWLLVLDREKQEKNLLAEQLKSVENEMKSKDGKATLQDMIKKLQETHQSDVDALKNELDRTVEQLQTAQEMLSQGEMSNDEKGQQIALLQDTVEHLQAQLKAESEKVKEADVKHSSLHSELKGKTEQINCMSLQISQQKELLAGLSQQLRDKDASIAQIMEAASNERMKLSEQNTSLIVQLESVEQAHKTSMKSLEYMSQQLEERISLSQSEIETKNLERLEQIKKIDGLESELAKVSREKDAMRKKLQAALVVRKDLLKQIEEHEKQKEESLNNKTEVSLLQDKLQEVTNQTQAAANEYQNNVSLLEQKILEKEGEILEYKAKNESLQSENQILQTTLNEKEVCLSEKLQTLCEKNSLVEQLQLTAADKEKEFEQQRNNYIQQLQELESEMKTCKEELKNKTLSAATVVDLENELAQVKSEKAMLQKKAQAALLARKETMRKAQENEKKLTQELAELKDDYKALLEQHCQQTNELNAIQLHFDENVKELEERHKTSLSYLDELDTLRQLVEERDKTLQELKMSLAEKESQCHSLSNLQTEMQDVKSKMESMSLELASKDEAFLVSEQQTQSLKSSLHAVENELDKARAELKDKAEEIERYQETLKVAELEIEQEKQALRNDNAALKTQLNISEMSQRKHSEEQYIWMEEKEVVLQQSNQIKAELETAVALVSQKSLEVLAIQKTLAETQQQLSEDKDVLTKELKEARLHCSDTERNLSLLQQEKEKALRLIDELRDEVTTLNEQLTETKKLNKQLQQRIPETCSTQEDVNKGVCSCNCAENFEVKLKERDDALSISQDLVAQKEELIAALELQLQQQIKMRELAIEKTRAETDELQKSPEDDTKISSQDNQDKIALLTRKLQAALVSRKELLKENATLKQQVENVLVKQKDKEAEYLALESSVLTLKQQNMDLESSVSSLNKENDQLSTSADRILNDNHSLSAACDSLKLTIENITQQKQAFSCQLESLKDSQTEELSKWKSKHAELKQEYESLLQAYENVSSEMDKMRQLLEGSKRERQEALRKIHKHETEMKILETQAKDMEEENDRMKERMHQFSKETQQKIEKLEEEKQKFREELDEINENHRMAMSELTDENQQLTAEICKLKESTGDLGVKLTEMPSENGKLAECLKEASCSMEKEHLESNTYTNSMQLKLDEALSLNNSLTAQIEAQKTELGAQMEINNILQKEKQTLSEKMEKIQNEYELQLGKKDDIIKELESNINRHSQETISLNEKVRILEDDKSLLQEELENVQEISDKVKNENEYLETVILKNAEKIDELTESVSALQSQNAQLFSQLAASKEMSNQVRQVKEEEQLKLVREFEEKLKTVQRGNEGSKNIKKELQELLKEKHQEINQLQQNCIKYQELILHLESSLKSSQSTGENLEKELKKCSVQISALEVRSKQLETELITHKNLLQEASAKLVNVESERDQLTQEVSQQSKLSEEQAAKKRKMLQNVDEKQMNSYIENQFVLQQQIDELKDLKEKESHKVNELRQQLDSQNLQINTLKRAAETNEVQLSALSSTPQGADATKNWNDLYQKTLHEKDKQLLEQGFVIKRFLDDIRVKDKEVNELRVTKSRLERTLNEYSVAAAAQQRQLFVMSASNAELSESVELMTVQVKELAAQVERMEQDKNALNQQLADKEDMISQMQLTLQQLEKINADADAQLLLLQSQNDKLQADFEKQEGIAFQLKTLLQGKNAEISSLLSCRDGQMSGYLEQLQANHRSQVAVYEDRLTSLRYQREQADKEMRGLEAKVKSLQVKVNKSVQEKEQMAAKMESFKNSMVSLQSEREHLMSEYRILEAKSHLGLKGKEVSADGEGGATKGLKHEIKKLLHQMDDLNSENAMLRAQLVRYREDLNQVLSLKDNQLKVLLKKQQDVIKTLENQKAAAEKQHRESRLELQKEEEVCNLMRNERETADQRVAELAKELLETEQQAKMPTQEDERATAKDAPCNRNQQLPGSGRQSEQGIKRLIQLRERLLELELSLAEERARREWDGGKREIVVIRSTFESAESHIRSCVKPKVQNRSQIEDVNIQRMVNMSLIHFFAVMLNFIEESQEANPLPYNRWRERERAPEMCGGGESTSRLQKEKSAVKRSYAAGGEQGFQWCILPLMDFVLVEGNQKEKCLLKETLKHSIVRRQHKCISRHMQLRENAGQRLTGILPGKRRCLDGSICCSKTSMYFLAFLEPLQMCKLPTA